jgi:hypothetical protein
LYLERIRLEAETRALKAEKLRLETERRALEVRLDAVCGLGAARRGRCASDRRERAQGTQRAYAIIGSAGRTATHWLAAAFNLHPQVFFSHGPDLGPRKTGRGESALDRFLRIAQQMDSFDFSDCDRYFDLLESQDGFTVYGNVHGIFPPQPEQLANAHRRAYFGCGIVRHPVPRVQSFVNRWRYEIQVSPLRRELYAPVKDDADQELLLSRTSRTYGVNCFDVDALLFMRALDTVVRFDKYFFDAGLPIYQMERLVADIDYFLNLFDHATAGLVEPDDDFLAALKKLQPIEQRQNGAAAVTCLASWAPWQKRYFRDSIAGAGLADAYEALGYNLRSIFARVA